MLLRIFGFFIFSIFIKYGFAVAIKQDSVKWNFKLLNIASKYNVYILDLLNMNNKEDFINNGFKGFKLTKLIALRRKNV